MALRNHDRSHSPSQSPLMRASPITAVREEEHIDDVEAYPPQQDVLTSSWSPDRRISRLPALPSASNSRNFPSSSNVIQSRQRNNNTPNTSRHVPQLISDSLSSITASSPFYQNAVLSATLASGSLPSSSSNNESLSQSPTGLRTPVFASTSQLAARYGIPSKLPQPPRLTSALKYKPPVPRFDDSPRPDPSPPDLNSLMSNYLAMISRSPDEAQDVTQSPAVHQSPLIMDNDQAAQDIAGLLLASAGSDITASPEWTDTLNDFLTSPFDDSPFEGMLETPAQPTSDLNEFLTSPVVANADTSFGDLPLFSNATTSVAEPLEDVNKMTTETMTPASDLMASPNFDNLFTMSPFTPSLDPLSMNSPQVSDSSTHMTSKKSKAKVPTGTRKGITPEALVPMDAPTQPRKYVAPSATSRKELPTVFARKRLRSVAFDEEEDELEDPSALPVTANEADAIAAKRRQNTLAARRSRKRKLEYQQQLEDSLEQERMEKEAWKTRAMMFHAQLQAYGYNVPLDDA